ncbi:MAG: methyltransferase domain-containing protein [Deltaproteobacteria bacterium]|nr:MAG: methyltransferase domain-containing protein [Deltaproteobacteria bacterium]
MEWVLLRVAVAPATADPLADFLLAEGAPAVVRETESTAEGRIIVEAHVPADTHGRVAAALASYLAHAGDAVVESAPLADVDWEAVFRRHHHPVLVGRRLAVAPPWDVPDAAGREVIVIEPGQAFGTGQHATTRMCLEEIEAAVAAGGVVSALDVGTGSGLLAAALARLGVPCVIALDVDPDVLPRARANLDRNGAREVRLICGRAAACRRCFDLVVANLLADSIVQDAAALAAVTAEQGRLVLSGLLDTQVKAVTAAFPAWRTVGMRAEDRWRALTLTRAG